MCMFLFSFHFFSNYMSTNHAFCNQYKCLRQIPQHTLPTQQYASNHVNGKEETTNIGKKHQNEQETI